MFVSVQKLAYLRGICRQLFVGVHSGSASTAALLLPWCGRGPILLLFQQGFVVHLMAFVAELLRWATYLGSRSRYNGSRRVLFGPGDQLRAGPT